jgi:hypothetical protein
MRDDKSQLIQTGNKNVKKTALRLAKALMSDQKLCTPLLILLSRLKTSTPFLNPDLGQSPLATMTDMVQDAFIQYVEFLWSNLDDTAIRKYIPGIEELCESYGIRTEVALYINRRKYLNRLKVGNFRQ